MTFLFFCFVFKNPVRDVNTRSLTHEWNINKSAYDITSTGTLV